MRAADWHPSLEEIRVLCEGDLPDFEQVYLEEHLASCEACMGIFSRLDNLIYTGLTAESHAAAMNAEMRAADPLVRAIRSAISVYRDVAGTLGAWLNDAAASWGEAPVRRLGEIGLLPVSGSVQDVGPIRLNLNAGETRAEVTVRSLVRPVEVVVAGAAEGDLILMFAVAPDGPILVAKVQTIDDIRVARFDHVVQGHYRLGVSPPPAT